MRCVSHLHSQTNVKRQQRHSGIICGLQGGGGQCWILPELPQAPTRTKGAQLGDIDCWQRDAPGTSILEQDQFLWMRVGLGQRLLEKFMRETDRRCLDRPEDQKARLGMVVCSRAAPRKPSRQATSENCSFSLESMTFGPCRSEKNCPGSQIGP